LRLETVANATSCTLKYVCRRQVKFITALPKRKPEHPKFNNDFSALVPIPTIVM